MALAQTLAKACRRKVRFGAGAKLGVALTCLAGCDALFAPPAPAPPPPRPEEVAPTPASLAVAQYFGRVEQRKLSWGLLREDGGGADTPFDAGDLARNFMTLAFADEFSQVDGKLVRREQANVLRRFQDPVRIQPIFGDAVPQEQRLKDRNNIQKFADRLAQATRHPVTFVDQNGNFPVLILTEDERRAIGSELPRLLPNIGPDEIRAVELLERTTYCVVLTSSNGEGTLKRSLAIIRAELPPVLRLSCIHEELAQGLGLSNDSPKARPSIFNDDDEFGRLTAMDELLLQMHYDPRLKPGMEAEAASVTVNEMVAELTAPAS